jgi:NAD-dependent dihydropyrimidine dehydrogenase PreA subunit
MKILEEKCSRCAECIPFCPVSAIVVRKKKILIDQDGCVECGVCLRSGVCRENALAKEELSWPRILRAVFSDPTVPHKKTDIAGRGTAEMKTNDVSGRIRRGEVGVAVELGRPGIATRFTEVEKVAREVACLGIPLEEANPVTALIKDREKGTFPPEILGEKVLSAIVEFKVPFGRMEEILEMLRRVAPNLETVASVSLIGRSDPEGSIPLEGLLKEKGIPFYPNGKVNIGLGRPLAEP